MSRSLLLDTTWDNGWRAAQTSPSEIHVELLKSGLIPDPYIGFNEHKVQWVGKVEWLYKCTFDFASQDKETHALLEFLGLDTLCDVYLNSDKILASDNMFQTHIVPLELSSLKPQNTLVLHFKSAHLLAKELEAQMGRVRAGSTNLGDPSRVYVRKAQYDWRWDWGPELMTCGPYRPITLKTYSARIEEVQTHALLSEQNAPSLAVDVTIAGSPVFSSLRIAITDAQNTLLKTQNVPATEIATLSSVVSWNLAGIVEPWWPVGYGAQNLYTVTVLLLDGSGQALDSYSTRVGFRRVSLVQEPLEEADQYGTGTTFLFEVNGVRIFIGGSNWVPGDNFLTTITPERYCAWLTLLRDGNQNMVRLWGGGVYEPDVFYDICDELGILVWQDFQFACGVYPAHDSFVASVRKEAKDNVKRLRHHPSLALFCGNNEDYQMILQWGDVKDFPAIKIYEEVLPGGCRTTNRTTAHSLPPWLAVLAGKDGTLRIPTIGDIHQWNIWGGKELPYQDYAKLGGRFVSEFGIPGHPEMKTIKYWMADAPKEQWHAQSALDCAALSVTEDLETYVYNYAAATTSGVIVWQLNDCWPVTSWAIADYFLRPKPVYFAIARQLAPVSVGIVRTVTKSRENDRPKQLSTTTSAPSYRTAQRLEIWGTNASLVARPATLEIHCVDLLTSWTHTETHAVTLLPNQATELLSIPCPGPPRESAAPSPHRQRRVYDDLLGRRCAVVLARFADWPQPFRFLEPAILRVPGLVLDVQEDADAEKGDTRVTVSVKRPVKGLVLGVLGDDDGPDVRWSDNGLDVMPGDPQVVVARGLAGRKIGVAFLGKEKTGIL
ncbi:glycoside hydrolase family 2 protein [Mycena amicta]|nr:glycoside hydrolase family 2 protein [Mycena amicta]